MDSVENIAKVLKTTKHHAFPVLNSNGKVVGIIPRNYVIILLKYQHFYNDEMIFDDSAKNSDQPFVERARSLSARKLNKTEEFVKQRSETYVGYSNYFDTANFPSTPANRILPHDYFMKDFWSNDLPVTEDIDTAIQNAAETA